jgi:2-polyprenyl-6-methoxyphenol hydroxylase-like FAD-dependent oxidoreductase
MSPSDNKPDAVIVGAGIAGSALAVSLARSGYGVTLLEKSTVMVADPELALPFLALQKGPFAVPSEAFSEHIWDRLLG